MKLVAILIVLAAGVATAAPREWSIDVPAGWTRSDRELDDQLARIRTLPTTVTVEAARYVSPDKAVQLTTMYWIRIHSKTKPPTHTDLEVVEQGMVDGASMHGSAPISNEAHFVGEQLVGDQVDEVNGVHRHQRRVFQADAAFQIQMVSAACVGPATLLAPCDHALETMQLHPTDPAPKPEPDYAYEIGRIVGYLVVVFAILLYFHRRKRREMSAPVR